MVLRGERTILRSWRNDDREAFAALHADAEVMRDLGGSIGRAASDAKLARYMAAYEEHGLCRWAVETDIGDFLGYVGVLPSQPDHPIGPHFEIGWRLIRMAWGKGFATDAARAALKDTFDRVGLHEVLAYTSADNVRSQAVMERLGLMRDERRDFVATYPDVGSWRGLVWVPRRPGAVRPPLR